MLVFEEPVLWAEEQEAQQVLCASTLIGQRDSRSEQQEQWVQSIDL